MLLHKRYTKHSYIEHRIEDKPDAVTCQAFCVEEEGRTMAVYSKEMQQTSQEILDFADLVFSLSSGSTDFEAILPKAYSQARQHIVTHHVMREKGAIQALVDVYPLTLAAGNLSLKCGYIGTVSVHPKARSKGYMIELMAKAQEDMRSQGYDMIILDGNRHRYQHYGFEKAGMKYCFNVTSDSIRHACSAVADLKTPVFQLIESAEDDLLDSIYEIYSRRNVTARERDSFYPCMQSWGADLYAVMLEEKCIGYLNTSEDGSSLYEIGLLDEQILPAVIYAYMQEMDIDELGINVGMDETAKLPLLDHISDYYTVSMSHQIRILQYESVIAFLLHWKRQYTSLQEGTFVLGIKEDQNTETIKITITEKDICVEKTTEPAQIMYDGLTLVKELTTSYYYISMQSKESALYQAPQGWFPLPFFLPEADAF